MIRIVLTGLFIILTLSSCGPNTGTNKKTVTDIVQLDTTREFYRSLLLQLDQVQDNVLIETEILGRVTLNGLELDITKDSISVFGYQFNKQIFNGFDRKVVETVLVSEYMDSLDYRSLVNEIVLNYDKSDTTLIYDESPYLMRFEEWKDELYSLFVRYYCYKNDYGFCEHQNVIISKRLNLDYTNDLDKDLEKLTLDTNLPQFIVDVNLSSDNFTNKYIDKRKPIRNNIDYNKYMSNVVGITNKGSGSYFDENTVRLSYYDTSFERIVVEFDDISSEDIFQSLSRKYGKPVGIRYRYKDKDKYVSYWKFNEVNIVYSEKTLVIHNKPYDPSSLINDLYYNP